MLQSIQSSLTKQSTSKSENGCRRCIRDLNNNFRKFPITCFGSRNKLFITPGIGALDTVTQTAIMDRVINFSEFTPENDPHGEADFGAFTESGHKVFWKIDYYSLDLKHGSPDPADPSVTCRVLTIMLADEY